MGTMEVKDKKTNEDGFIGSHRLSCKISRGRKHTLEFWLVERFFPNVAMIRSNLKQARNSAGVTVSPESDAGENEPAHDRDGLQPGKPILGEPLQP